MKASRWYIAFILVCCTILFASCTAIPNGNGASDDKGKNSQKTETSLIPEDENIKSNQQQKSWESSFPGGDTNGDKEQKQMDELAKNQQEAIEKEYTKARANTLYKLVKSGVITKQQAEELENGSQNSEILKDMSPEQKKEIETSLEKSYIEALHILVDEGLLSEQDANTYKPFIKDSNLSD